MTAHVLAKAYRLLAQLPLLEACRAMSHDSSPVPFVPRSAKHVRRDTDVHGCDWHEETRSSGVETWCVWWALAGTKNAITSEQTSRRHDKSNGIFHQRRRMAWTVSTRPVVEQSPG